jgi:hypothetical protein
MGKQEEEILIGLKLVSVWVGGIPDYELQKKIQLKLMEMQLLLERGNPIFNFEPLYKKYPRKMGKTQGMKKAKATVKTEADYIALSKAIDRFNQYHQKKGTEADFIPHFSTFMTSWRDWLEEDTGTAQSSATQSFDIRRLA